jgi:hypothetical protein
MCMNIRVPVVIAVKCQQCPCENLSQQTLDGEKPFWYFEVLPYSLYNKA